MAIRILCSECNTIHLVGEPCPKLATKSKPDNKIIEGLNEVVAKPKKISKTHVRQVSAENPQKTPSDAMVNADHAKFDRNAYQREYMRKKRAEKRILDVKDG